MTEKWNKLLPQLIINLSTTEKLICPECGKHTIDYLYIGNLETRMGYMQFWCNSCLKGAYVSRAKAPDGAKMIDINDLDEIKNTIPDYEFVED